MLYGRKSPQGSSARFALVSGLCALSISVAVQVGAASAQGTAPPRTVSVAPGAQAAVNSVRPNGATTANRAAGRRYYIEFRARSALTYGHTFAIYGRLGERSKIATKEVVGLHPFTESSVPWMIGHLVPVPSEVGASDGDTEDEYVIARFRVVLNEPEYKKLLGYIAERRKNSPVWHAALYNCNAFIGDVARFMGLEVPGFIWQMPKDYIDGIRDANIDRQDLTGVLGVPVKVESADALREAAQRASAEKEKRASAETEKRQQRAQKPAAPKPAAARPAAPRPAVASQ
jgi:hypothetical protein